MKLIPSASTSVMNLDMIKSSSSFIRAFELSVDFAIDSVNDSHIRKLVELKRERELRYSVHAPFRDINIASLNTNIFETAKKDMIRSIEFAAKIEAEAIVVHPGITGYFPKSKWPEMKLRELSVFQALGAIGERHGILVNVENLPKMNVHFEDTWTLEGIVKLYDTWTSEVKGVCLDIGHAHHAGLGAADAVKRLGKRIKHLHLHDNHAGMIDEHLPIGEGTVSWDEFFPALRETDFEGFAVFEFGPAEKQQKAIEYLKAKNYVG